MKKIAVTITLIFVVISASTAADRTAVATGNWFTSSVWDCNCVPSSSDNVIIPAGIRVTVFATILDMTGSTHITITVGGELLLSSSTLLLNGSDVINILSGGTITESGIGGLLTSGFSGFTNFPINGPATITGGTLPVELIAFNVSARDESVVVAWETASQTDLSNFVIERSVDGIMFTAIATVDPAEASVLQAKYEYIDDQPIAGRAYYRLRSIDLDEVSHVFYVKTIDMSQITRRLTVFPTHVANGSINIRSNNVDDETTVTITGSMGRPLKTFPLTNGVATADVNDLPSGIYYIIAQTTRTKLVARFIVP